MGSEVDSAFGEYHRKGFPILWLFSFFEVLLEILGGLTEFDLSELAHGLNSWIIVLRFPCEELEVH